MQNIDLLTHEQLLELADVISHFLSFDLNYNVLPYVEHSKLYNYILDISDILNQDPISFMDLLNKSRSDKQRPE